ncbi:hypothetical protein B0H11DRAFT_2282000 [Mycena galericulata]|nr:hypothetical protein B0H11DRAFT_2282000 [Mycena galericulata]
MLAAARRSPRQCAAARQCRVNAAPVRVNARLPRHFYQTLEKHGEVQRRPARFAPARRLTVNGGDCDYRPGVTCVPERYVRFSLQRHVTGMVLPNLPAEIWDTVLKLCRRHQIRRLSLVSGQFRSLCLPLLLRDQSFAHEVISHQDLERAVVRFDELSQEAFSQHVRSWHCAFPDNTQDLTAQVIDAFLTKIGAFRKLTSLRINLVIVDRVLIDILKDLPLLEDLALDDCSIECREASMNLLSLELSGHDIHAASPLQLASSRNLQILRVGAEMDPRALIDGFGDDDELIKLRDLAVDDLSAAFVDRFFAFLQRCPQLECLEIGNCPRPLATRINLSAPTYLRSLRAVKAPPEVVQLLIPHRLLSVVAFQREAPGSFELLEIQRACHLFRESAAALETLSIQLAETQTETLSALIVKGLYDVKTRTRERLGLTFNLDDWQGELLRRLRQGYDLLEIVRFRTAR